MINLFKELAKDLNPFEPKYMHGKLTDQQLRDFPDLFYPFDEMIEYAKKNWVDYFAKERLIKDLRALKKIMQAKYDMETTSEIKIQDDIILSLPIEALDGYMKRRKLSEVKSLFNPISNEAKKKLNESYKRTHSGT
jgi:hypothetical protein